MCKWYDDDDDVKHSIMMVIIGFLGYHQWMIENTKFVLQIVSVVKLVPKWIKSGMDDDNQESKQNIIQ